MDTEKILKEHQPPLTVIEQIKNLKIPNIDGMDQDIENKEKIDEEDIWKF